MTDSNGLQNGISAATMSLEFIVTNGETTSHPPSRLYSSLRLKSSSLRENKIDVDAIGAFKHSPSFEPHHYNTTRPVMERSCNCMQGKKKDMDSTQMKELGMRNILNFKLHSGNNGILTRWFPAEICSFKKPLFKKYHDVSVSVLASPRVRLAVQETARQIIESSNDLTESQALVRVEKDSKMTIKKMRASVSSVFIKFAGWFLTKFLGLFISSVQVSEAQMKILKKRKKKGVPMIYLPLHKSHLDYILITLTLWHYDIRSPYVAAGDNLDIPFFGLMMKGLGGFFIRRRLDPKTGHKDVLYRAILHEYMTELLRDGEGFEFFIEGGRSRTGRAIIPKGGLLSVVVEACNSGDISDAIIIPASFSYEKVIDGNFNREQMGLPKIAESFFGTLQAILRVIMGRYGSIRLNFAQPFSLKEFLDATNNNPFSAPLTPPDQPHFMIERGMSYPNLSQPLLSDSNNGMNTRMLVKALADHTVYTCVHSIAPMSTHITAFLLLTKHRQGVSLKDLSKSIRWIVWELQVIHVDVGFCGKAEDVVLYAQNLLGHKLISKTWNKEQNDYILQPNLSLPSVFELSYYSNFVTTHFVIESVLACAILCESKLSFFRLLSATPGEEKKFTREIVLETAQKICHLIQSEYILVPPCEELILKLSEILDSFISKELLTLEKEENNFDFHGADSLRMANFAKSLDIEEDEYEDTLVQDQSLKVNVKTPCMLEKLHFLVCICGPILESEYVTCKFILSHLQGEKPESEFYQDLGNFARFRVSDGTAIFSENCAILNLKSAVKSVEQLKLLYSYRSANMTMVGLSQNVGCIDTLKNYVQLLEGVLY